MKFVAFFLTLIVVLSSAYTAVLIERIDDRQIDRNEIVEQEPKVSTLLWGGAKTVESCDANSCNSACQSRGWDGGVCYAGSCWCYKGSHGRRVGNV
ncbi:hypothetical protein NQ318_020612 [Aromia moschata]|uniref:Uncharacterized protein n=1 Tax=Aromia moschata TaxID=1265417 RepID=A0AAV8Z3B6_9CUCU|nr:hypothetical protein NQ318_020612 [Aromia moschata]